MEMNDPGLHVAGARTKWDGARTVASLWGEHDLVTADRLAEFLTDAVAVGDDLVIDLSEVRFMDASTISAILRVRSRVAEHAGELTVRSPSALVERALDACGLTELIERAEGAGEWPDRARSALESWVAVPPRNPTPSTEVQSVPRERQESRE